MFYMVSVVAPLQLPPPDADKALVTLMPPELAAPPVHVLVKAEQTCVVVGAGGTGGGAAVKFQLNVKVPVAFP